MVKGDPGNGGKKIKSIRKTKNHKIEDFTLKDGTSINSKKYFELAFDSSMKKENITNPTLRHSLHKHALKLIREQKGNVYKIYPVKEYGEAVNDNAKISNPKIPNIKGNQEIANMANKTKKLNASAEKSKITKSANKEPIKLKEDWDVAFEATRHTKEVTIEQPAAKNKKEPKKGLNLFNFVKKNIPKIYKLTKPLPKVKNEPIANDKEQIITPNNNNIIAENIRHNLEEKPIHLSSTMPKQTNNILNKTKNKEPLDKSKTREL